MLRTSSSRPSSSRPSSRVHFARPAADEIVLTGGYAYLTDGEAYGPSTSVSTKPGEQAKALKIAGLYSRAEFFEVPEGFKRLCKRENMGNCEYYWQQINGRNDWYRHETSGAYIYFNRGDERWWIDNHFGVGVYFWDLKKHLGSVDAGRSSVDVSSSEAPRGQFQEPRHRSSNPKNRNPVDRFKQKQIESGSVVPLGGLREGWEMTEKNIRLRRVMPWKFLPKGVTTLIGGIDTLLEPPVLKVSDNYPVAMLADLGLDEEEAAFEE
mmetsp:Transcript_8036/g.19361  ORF Transcript_8036/g.19361 Transcript_8036/m.19361 type:complete len:266 (-) Transcript_8036:169-966(-)